MDLDKPNVCFAFLEIELMWGLQERSLGFVTLRHDCEPEPRTQIFSF